MLSTEIDLIADLRSLSEQSKVLPPPQKVKILCWTFDFLGGVVSRNLVTNVTRLCDTEV